MTPPPPAVPQEQVEGGLDDPSALEPEQGTLALAGPGDPTGDDEGRAAWEAAAAAVLRKARRLTDDDPDAAVWAELTRTTLDGIELTPLGTADLLEGLTTAGRPTRAGEWDIRSHTGMAGSAGATAVNEELMTDLEGGVSSLWLGVEPDTDLSALLDGVLLDLAPVILEAPDAPEAVAEEFLAQAERTGLTPHPATNLGFDAATATAEQAALAGGAGVRGFVVAATVPHDAGASDAQDLGWAIATAATYLRRLGEAGVDLGEAARLVEFRVAVTDDQFAGIAKLRAVRRLWARMLELSEIEPVPMALHAVTSRPMTTEFDPWVNMLRTTVAAFAAGVGGADAVTVLPFDSALGRPETLGRRVARNTSALLISESHLARVADPAGGAYAVEKLTDDLALAAWAELGRIEEEGFAAFDARVAETAERRDRLVATRTLPITGVTEFPHLAETRPERAADDAFVAVRSYAAAFETMRLDPPAAHVFLATLGPIAAHTARATFASNLLAAGGIGVDVAGATDGVETLLAAYAGQPVACLAGPDAAYTEWGSKAAAALRGAGATRIVVAGKPVEWADDDCAMGVDAVDFLTRTRGALS